MKYMINIFQGIGLSMVANAFRLDTIHGLLLVLGGCLVLVTLEPRE